MAPPIVDRVVPVDHVALCPQMDIIALVAKDGSLTVNRTTSWQRLMKRSGQEVSALCWSPDGKSLATGHANGSIRVMEVEQEDADERDDATPVPTWGALSTLRLKHRVVTMTWSAACSTHKAPTDDIWELCRIAGAHLASAYLERGEKLMPPPDKLPEETSKPKFDFGDDDDMDIENLALLVSIDAQAQAVLSLDGQFAVAAVDLTACYPQLKYARAFALSGDLTRLHLWGSNTETLMSRLSTLEFKAIEQSKRQLVPCVKQFVGLSSLLDTARDALSTAQQRYTSTLATIDEFFESWAGYLVDDETVLCELFATLVVGVSSQGTARFIEARLTDEAELVKMHKTLDANMASAETALIGRLLPAGRHVFYRASELDALARGHEVLGYDRIGWNDTETNQLTLAAKELVLRGEECLEAMRTARLGIAMLCGWLADLALLSKKDEASPQGDDEQPAAVEPKLPAHLRTDLIRLIDKAIAAPPELPSLSTTERVVLGPFALTRALCDPDDNSQSSEAIFLLGASDLEDAAKRADPATEPSKDDISLAARIRECVEIADVVFGSVRRSFEQATVLAKPLDLDVLPFGVALHARIGDMNDDGKRVLCCVAKTPDVIWILEILGARQITARSLRLDAPLLRVGFYGAQAGFRSKHDEKLVLLVGPSPDEPNDHVWLLDDDKYLEDRHTVTLRSPDDMDADDDYPRGLHDVISDDEPALTAQSGHEVAALKRPKSKHLFVSGCRGVACVLAEPNVLTIYDLEDLEDDDDDEDDEDDDDNEEEES